MHLRRSCDVRSIAGRLAAAVTGDRNVSGARRCDLPIIDFDAVVVARSITIAGPGDDDIAAAADCRRADDPHADIVAGTCTADAGNLNITGRGGDIRCGIDLHAVVCRAGSAAAAGAENRDISGRGNDVRCGIDQHADAGSGRRIAGGSGERGAAARRLQLGRSGDQHAIAVGLAAAVADRGNDAGSRGGQFRIVEFNAVTGCRAGTFARS